MRLNEIHYLTDGIRSLRTIPDASVDLVWSNAVLEHVERDQFSDLLTELRRILRPDGVMSHQVDLQDHLGGALNNLRFTDALRESGLFRRSGFYTNRIRYSEMLAAFRAAGFVLLSQTTETWDASPTPRKKMNRRFARLAEEELRVASFRAKLCRADARAAPHAEIPVAGPPTARIAGPA